MNTLDLQKLLRKAWSKKTSFDPEGWTPENPAWGQCGVTALAFQDFFGGDILRELVTFSRSGKEQVVSHYWNILPEGQRIDLTREQFSPFTVSSISQPEPRAREDMLRPHPSCKKQRYVILRLTIENLIQPNPLFSHPLYRLCFETALESDCKKTKFGCVVLYESAWGEKLIALTANKSIEPLRHLCEPECARLKIQSRTESMIGACCHAEEWALKEIHEERLSPKLCSIYVAGFDAKTLKPWLKKETEDFSCLRCAVQLYMAGLGKIYVPAIDRWEAITPEEALKSSIQYALGEKKI